MSKTFKTVAQEWRADKKQYVKKSTYAAYSLLLFNHLLPEFAEAMEILRKPFKISFYESWMLGLDRNLSRIS